MPMFEYSCKSCDKEFEALVRTNSPAPSCPACQGSELEKLISTPAIKSDSTHSLAMRAAKKRDSAQAQERMYTQLQYEQSHDRHG